MNPEWRARYETAVEAAQRAGRLALSHFPEGAAADFAGRVEWKQDNSPVSLADREAEVSLRDTLLTAFPRDGFLGEEYGEKEGASGFRWIVDPIDGTRAFVRGIPFWTTLVGLEYQSEQIAGVVELPALGRTFRALRGDGAYRGEQRIRVSDVSRLDQAQVLYSSLKWFAAPGSREAFLRLAAAANQVRGFGEAYGYMLVAQGSGEVMLEHGVHPWDVAAIKPIVEEAGGRYTDWDDNATIDRPDSLATNGRLHDETLRVLRGG